MALFVLVTVLFFLWGMSNNLTDILVQQFRKSFELSQLGAQLVQTANFLGYFSMAIPAALVMRRFGYKAGMVLGLALFGTRAWCSSGRPQSADSTRHFSSPSSP